jgi:outer membrane protein insertion porin family
MEIQDSRLKTQDSGLVTRHSSLVTILHLASCVLHLISCVLYLASLPCSAETVSDSSLQFLGLPVVSIKYTPEDEAEDKVRSATAIQEGEIYSRSRIRESIEGIYALGDFSDVKVDAQPEKNGVALTFILVKKIKTRNISLEGNRGVSNDQIIGVIKLKPGYEYDDSIAQMDVESIKRLYRDRGYFGADVQFKTVVDDKSSDADVTFRITSQGERPLVEKIIIVGTSEAVIRKKQVFTTDLKYQANLDRGNIPEGLLQDFENKENSLSYKATVSIEEAGTQWLITDGQNIYSIRKEAGNLSVYQTDSLLAVVRKVKLGEPYQGQQALDSDAKLIEEAIRNKGYMTAKVKNGKAFLSGSDMLKQYSGQGKHFAINTDRVPIPKVGTVVVVFEIAQGRKVYIKIEGDKHVKDDELKRSIAAYKMNSVSRSVLLKSNEDIKNLYKAKGYYLAKVDHKILKDEVWNFSTGDDTKGWEPEIPDAFASLRISDGTLRTSLSDNISEKTLYTKPLLRSPTDLKIYTDTYQKIQIRMKTNKGSSGRLYWLTRKSGKWSENRRHVFELISDDQFHDYSVNFMLGNENWSGTVTRLGFSPADVPGADISIEWIKVITDSITVVFIVDANRQMKIEDAVTIKAAEGELQEAPEDVRKQMLTRKKNPLSFWPLRRYLPGGIFDEAVFQADLRAIIAFYKDKGYSNARIDGTEILPKPEEGKIDIIITIYEGHKTFVSAVILKGNGKDILNSKDALARLPGLQKQEVVVDDSDPSSVRYNITSSKVFRDDDIVADRSFLRSWYADKGYLAKIEPIKEFNDGNAVDITYQITRGQLLRIDDEIEIRGNMRTKHRVIERELSKRLTEEKIFSYSEIASSWQRLLDLGFFRSVRIDTKPIGEDLVKMTVDVVERNPLFLNIKAGLGSSKDRGGEVEARIVLEAAHINLWGTGRRLGGKTQFGTEGISGQIDYTEPRLLGTRAQGLIDLHRNSLRKGDDTENWMGFTVGVSQRFRRVNSITPRYRYDVVKYGKEEKEVARIGSIETTFQRDVRDNPLNPRRGWLHVITTEYANRRLGGDKTFAKFSLSSTRYLSLTQNIVIALGARTGYAWGLTSTEEDFTPKQFSLSDYNIPRGFSWEEEEELGNVMLNIGTEIRFPIYKWIGAALFFDSGHVTKEVADFDPWEMNSSIGLGLRFFTPIGPLRLDYGYPVNGAGTRSRFPQIAFGQAF